MKRILMAAALCCSMAATAQDTAVDRFVSTYGGSGSIYSKDPWEHQMNKPIPDFYFNKELNSKSLKGKVVVLDFWATWCTGCLVVSHGLDSLMVKDTKVYNNVQVIGVNTKEKMVDKGLDAHQYWKKTGKAFPMVEGPGADSCGTSVKNGFPTVILVDDKGIVRKRWDGAGPQTAGSIRVNAWKYAVWPKVKNMPVTVASAKQLLAQRDWVSALYFLEAMPEQYDTVSILKLQAMLQVSENAAATYAGELKAKLKDTPAYDDMMMRMIQTVANTGTINQVVLKPALAAAEELRLKPAYRNNYLFRGYMAQLRWSNTEFERQRAAGELREAIMMAPKENADLSAIKRFEELKSKYEKQLH
jgi:thiol-disulfide isomerase/thioredoxin